MLRRTFQRFSSTAGTLHAALRSIKKTRVGLWLPAGACESSIAARRALWGRDCTVVPLPYKDKEAARQMVVDSRTRSILVETGSEEAVELCRGLGVALLPMDRLLGSVPAVESDGHLPDAGPVHVPSISYYHVGRQCPLSADQLANRARNTANLLALNEQDSVLVCGSADAGADFEDLQAARVVGAKTVDFNMDSAEDVVVAARESRATIIIGDCGSLREVAEVMVRIDPVYREEILLRLRAVVCDLPWRHSSRVKNEVDDVEARWREATGGTGPDIIWRARLGETGSLFTASADLKVLRSIENTAVELAVDPHSNELCVKDDSICTCGYFERPRSSASEFSTDLGVLTGVTAKMKGNTVEEVGGLVAQPAELYYTRLGRNETRRDLMKADWRVKTVPMQVFYWARAKKGQVYMSVKHNNKTIYRSRYFRRQTTYK